MLFDYGIKCLKWLCNLKQKQNNTCICAVKLMPTNFNIYIVYFIKCTPEDNVIFTLNADFSCLNCNRCFVWSIISVVQSVVILHFIYSLILFVYCLLIQDDFSDYSARCNRTYFWVFVGIRSCFLSQGKPFTCLEKGLKEGGRRRRSERPRKGTEWFCLCWGNTHGGLQNGTKICDPSPHSSLRACMKLVLCFFGSAVELEGCCSLTGMW